MVRSGLAVVATFGLGAVASAQTWYAAPAPGNVGAGAYWNNKSADNNTGGVCNLGAVLMGKSTATNPLCSNERPATLLPLSAAQQLTGVAGTTRGTFLAGGSALTPTGFMFGAGQYTFDLYGRIAGFAFGAPPGPRFGYYTFNSVGARVLTELLGGVNTGTATFTTGSNWGFWLSSFRPGTGSAGTAPFNVWFSDMKVCSGVASLSGSCTALAVTATQQFALFSSTIAAGAGSSVQPYTLGERFWVGGEDNACKAGGVTSLGAGTCSTDPSDRSDYDYQDVIGSFSATAVPEPASLLLVGTGLLGLIGVGLRRRNS